MERRAFIAIAGLSVAQLLLGGCAPHDAQELPQLVIGYSEYRPYIYVDDNGEYAGSDVELAQEACRRMGYAPVFKEINWEERDEYLASGEVDCLWSCFSMDDREQEYAWVGPYMNSREVVAVLETSAIQSLADLKARRVAVKVSTKPEAIFLERTDKRIPKVQDVYCLTSTEEMVSALRNEYVDACAGHAAALRYCLQTADVSYRFLDEDLLHVRLGVAFSPESNEALRDSLASALKDMRADGTERAILEKYGLDADKVLEGVDDGQQAQ